MKYDGVRIRVNLVQSVEYVDGRRSMDVNMNMFRILYISSADALSLSFPFFPCIELLQYVKSC